MSVLLEKKENKLLLLPTSLSMSLNIYADLFYGTVDSVIKEVPFSVNLSSIEVS